MTLRVAYNRSTAPVISSDEGHVIAAGGFGVVESTDDAVKLLLEPDEPMLRLLRPAELEEPTADQPPHREDLTAAIAELDRRQDEADAAAAAAAEERAAAEKAAADKQAAADAKAAAKAAPKTPAKAAATTTTPGA